VFLIIAAVFVLVMLWDALDFRLHGRFVELRVADDPGDGVLWNWVDANVKPLPIESAEHLATCDYWLAWQATKERRSSSGARASESPLNGPIKVLVIDDCKVIADMIAMVLEQSLNVRAKSCYFEAEALSTAAEWQPNVILAGLICVPSAPGFGLALDLQEMLPSAEVMTMTEYPPDWIFEVWREKTGEELRHLCTPIHSMDFIPFFEDVCEFRRWNVRKPAATV